MNLQTWLKLHNIHHEDFAQKIGRTEAVVRKYLYEGVIPRRGVMIKIFRLTVGVVTANDFYNLSSEELGKEVDAKVKYREPKRKSV